VRILFLLKYMSYQLEPHIFLRSSMIRCIFFQIIKKKNIFFLLVRSILLFNKLLKFFRLKNWSLQVLSKFLFYGGISETLALPSNIFVRKSVHNHKHSGKQDSQKLSQSQSNLHMLRMSNNIFKSE